MILEQIVRDKRAELKRRQRVLPLSRLEERLARQSPPRDFAAAIRGDRVRLIAEVKKASPSRGVISPHLDAVALATTYAENGAAAISVLTERKYFQGNLPQLAAIRKALEMQGSAAAVPLLRKDFIFDPYQVYESRAYGADALLLIVAILDDIQLATMITLSHGLGMQCLVEVHDEAELDTALASGARVIGINNRNLRTFEVDTATTLRLRPLIPADCTVVSESGIGSRKDVEELQALGVHAILVGEALLTAPDVAAKMRELV